MELSTYSASIANGIALNIKNSTIEGGGATAFVTGLGVYNRGHLFLDNVTIFGQPSSAVDTRGGRLVIRNTILANTGCIKDEFSAITDLGGNLVQSDPNNCGDLLLKAWTQCLVHYRITVV